MGDAARAAAEPVFQSTRPHSTLLQRAARPEHPRRFRAAHRGFVEVQTGHCSVAETAGRRRSGPAQALRAKRRHTRQHVQHRPGGRTPHRARQRLPARPDRPVRHGGARVRSVAARRGKSPHVQRRVSDEPPSPRQALVRPHRAEGMPDSRHLRQGFLRRPPRDHHEHLRSWQSDLHRHDEPPAFLLRSHHLAATVV